MQIRKLHRMGTSYVMTVPSQVIRRWRQAHTLYVIIDDLVDELRVRPLSTEELLHYPRPEEEELDGRPVR